MKRSKINDLTNKYSINRSKTVINFQDQEFNDDVFNNSIGSSVDTNIKSASLQLNHQHVNKIFNKLDKRSNNYLEDSLEIMENKIDLIDDDQSDLNDSLNDSNFYKNNDVCKKDLKNIIFLLFLYFLQGIYLIIIKDYSLNKDYLFLFIRYSIRSHWFSTIHIKLA